MGDRGRLAGAVALVLTLAGTASAPADTGPADLVARYLDQVRAGEVAAARALWSTAYLTASARLGITYPATEYPFDLASPLHAVGADPRAPRAPLQVGAGDSAPGGFTVPVTVPGDDGRPPYLYAVIDEDGAWKLANAAWAATRAWPRTDSAYFSFLCRDPSLLSAPAVAALDAFVAATATDLGLGDDRLADLRRLKIPYVLADEATVTALTGYATKGMADLAAGLIISSHFPHFHEVAHLLVNFALGDAPLYPPPVLQEGTASLLGGRWGRAPAVILHMGWVGAEMGFVDVGDLLTREGFHAGAGGPDATYPAAAVLCDLIAHEAGYSALLGLQQALAAPPGPGPDANGIAAAIGRACGWSADRPLPTLVAHFDAWRERFRRAGVAPGGPAANPPAAAAAVTLITAGDDIVFTVPGGDEMVALLPAGPSPADAAGSALFAEILPGVDYAGQRCGVRCSAASISVYDFTTNRLVGVWVGDFTGEPGGAAVAAGVLRFRVAGGLLPDGPTSSWRIVTP